MEIDDRKKAPTLRIAVCEDNKHQLGIIGYLLGRYSETRPGVEIQWDGYTNGFNLLEGIRHGREYDLFLLDIIMPDISGIAVAEAIRGERADAPIVFMTASADYALDAFHVSALQYLLKPVRETALFPVLDKAVTMIDAAKKEPPFFLVNTADDIKVVLHTSIVCVESQRRTLLVYLNDGNTIQSKPFRGNFETAIAPLLEDGHFLHAHKSFVLNMDHVRRIADRSFTMTNDVEIFIPRYKFADMKGKYFAYITNAGGGLLGESRAVEEPFYASSMPHESTYS